MTTVQEQVDTTRCRMTTVQEQVDTTRCRKTTVQEQADTSLPVPEFCLSNFTGEGKILRKKKKKALFSRFRYKFDIYGS